MPHVDPLAALNRSEQNRLESLLMEFEDNWSLGALASYCKKAKEASSQVFEVCAVAELVKIDLQRAWKEGHGRRLEEYFAMHSSLGSTSTADVELILAEYTARRLAGHEAPLAEYAERFPNQYAEFAKRAETAADSQFGANSQDANRPQEDRRTQHNDQSDTSRVSRIASDESRREAASGSMPNGDLPSEFGRYRIVRKLGAGAMGTVYLAHDTLLDRQVAIKTPSFANCTPELVERFYREARAAAKLHHRNICPIYDVGTIGGTHFISMAYLRGRNLSQYVLRDRLLPPKTAVLLVHRLATALAEAHRHKVIHRDLKPDNIKIDLKGEPVVMDFGLARRTDNDARMTHSGMVIGTPAYLAPEQLQEDAAEATPAVDIYALGVVFYELLTGELPHKGSLATLVYKIVHEAPTSPCELRAGLSSEVASICMKMIAKNVEDRYASMDAVAADLKSYLRGMSQGETDKMQPVAEDADDSTDKRYGELNEQLLANAPATGQQTLIEPSALSRQLSVDTSVRRPRSMRHRWPNKLLIAIGFLGALIASLAIMFLIRTPYGTVRVEVRGNADDLEVLVDNEKITISDGQWEGKKKSGQVHQLTVRVAGQTLQVGSPTIVRLPDGSKAKHRLTLELDGSELSSDSFELNKGAESVIRITCLKDVGEPATESARAEVKPTPRAAEGSSATSPEKRSVIGLEKPAASTPPTVTEILLSDEWKWSRPVCLPPGINTKYADSGPVLSPDGLTLFFASQRPGGSGSYDIWMSKRVSRDSQWQPPVNLGSPINSSGDEYPGAVSWDGKTLYFSARRDGETDIWIAHRSKDGVRWNAPTRLGSPVNSSYADYASSISHDGLSLYIASDRTGTLGGLDIWVTHRRSLDAPWSKPINLGPQVNTSEREEGGYISSDGLTLLFGASLKRGARFALWMASRRTLDEPFQRRFPLPAIVNQGSTSSGATLSADGTELFFHSNASNGIGSWDIWVTKREITELESDRRPSSSAAVSPGNALTNDSAAVAKETRPNVPRAPSSVPGTEENESATHGRRGNPTPTEILTSDEWVWSEPQRLPRAVNARESNGFPCLSSDGRLLIFARRRDVKKAFHLYTARRTDIQSPWQPARPAGSELHARGYDARCPCLSADGLTLVFSSSRPGGLGKADLWMATRPSIGARWGKPHNLGPVVNSPTYELGACFSPDGTELYFSSNGKGGYGASDIWVTRRKNIRSPWQPPVNLGPGVNTAATEMFPCITSDGLTLLYGSGVVGKRGMSLWASHRTGKDKPFAKGAPLDDRLRVLDEQNGPTLSVDGRELYFHAWTNDVPGYEDATLWTAHRIPREHADSTQSKSAKR